MLHLLVLVAILAVDVSARPSSRPANVYEHERADLVHPDWVRRSRVDSNATIPFRIGLVQSNLEQGDDLLMEISDPSSSKYGQHYSAAQIAEIFAPSQDTVNAVHDWLLSEGFSHERILYSPSKHWVRLDATFTEIERLLHTEYFEFDHTSSGDMDIACEKYHLPHSVKNHVDFVLPGVKLGPIRDHESAVKERSADSSGSSTSHLATYEPLPIPYEELQKQALSDRCPDYITPDCVRKMYNISSAPYESANGNQVGIFEYRNGEYLQFSLDRYFNLQAQHIPKGTHPEIRSIDGGKATGDLTGAESFETELDLQVSYGLLNAGDVVEFPVRNRQNYYYNKFANTLGMNDFLDGLDGAYCKYKAFGIKGNTPGLDEAPGDVKDVDCGVQSPTNVISISYGWGEGYLPIKYQRRQCMEWMKLAMRGITTVIASGDAGVGNQNGFSKSGCLGKNSQIFQPGYPTTCPYLLTVGGTYLPNGANVGEDEEHAVKAYGSGGGFSNIHPSTRPIKQLPKYQKSQVENFFSKHAPPYPYYKSHYNSSFGAHGGIYNRAGRGLPDVSAVAHHIFVIYKGVPVRGGGTSSSAPLWASILTRINAARLRAGKSTVGFVHPVLVFHDITIGNNPGCSTNGFNATEGWDPVTGLGTPNYPKLLDLFMSLP